jgi:hypothetical protein
VDSDVWQSAEERLHNRHREKGLNGKRIRAARRSPRSSRPGRTGARQGLPSASCRGSAWPVCMPRVKCLGSFRKTDLYPVILQVDERSPD